MGLDDPKGSSRRAAYDAYAAHLEPFHNWLLKHTFQARTPVSWSLQPDVVKAATVSSKGCKRLQQRVQPHAAATCSRGDTHARTHAPCPCPCPLAGGAERGALEA